MDNRRIKILTINGNQNNLISLKALINNAFTGATVFTALTGQKGLELAVDGDPDLIFLDVDMPLIDGLEVCQRMKADRVLSKIPVIIAGDKESRILALESGADIYLVKPIDESEFTNCVHAMLRIKDANIQKRNEKERFAVFAEEKTRELREAHLTALNLLEDLKKEIEAGKEREKALLESVKKYRQITEHISDVVFTADLNFKTTYISPSVEKMLGEPIAIHLNRTMEEKLTPDSLKKVTSILFEELEKEKDSKTDKNRTRIIEAEHYRADGTTIWISMHVSFIRDINGKPVGYQGVSRDITERKQVEKNLRESEDRAQRQRDAIARLVLDAVMVTGEIPKALRKITEVLSDIVGVKRAGIWILNEESTQLKCLSLFEAGIEKHSKGMALKAKEIPNYFGAILKEKRVCAEDAQKDPRTSELLDIYLKPLGITSILDTAIMIEGELKGVICLEHVGKPRKWYPDEEAFVYTIASMVAQLFINDERRRLNRSLQFQLDFEKMLYEIAVHFISLPSRSIPSRQFDDGIKYALQRIGNFFKVDRSYLFQFSTDGKTMSNTYEWCAEGVVPEINSKQMVPVESMPWWAERIRTDNNVHVSDVDKLPQEAAIEKKLCQSQGIRSFLQVPIRKGGSQIGFLGFDAVKQKISWTRKHLVLTRVITELITNALIRFQAEKTIQYLSFHDQLTGLYNRSFFEEELKRLDSVRNLPLTLVIADVNGLKLTNDVFGHSMGDQLLQRAAEVIKKECRTDDIIARIGGDEFVLLLPKTDYGQAELIVKRISRVITNQKIGPLNLSVSFGWETKRKTTEEITAILKKADDNMYRSKLSESTRMRHKTIEMIINNLYEKNEREQQHSKRVSQICTAVGAALGLSRDDLSELGMVGLLHDLGKITIENRILDKPGLLSTEERAEIERHVEIGYRILSSVSEFAPLAEYVLAHHERWDGQGYPRGLKGEEIPLKARIIALADSYDAMTRDRPYRKALSESAAIEEIKRKAGSQFDPHIARVFVKEVLGKE